MVCGRARPHPPRRARSSPSHGTASACAQGHPSALASLPATQPGQQSTRPGARPPGGPGEYRTVLSSALLPVGTAPGCAPLSRAALHTGARRMAPAGHRPPAPPRHTLTSAAASSCWGLARPWPAALSPRPCPPLVGRWEPGVALPEFTCHCCTIRNVRKVCPWPPSLGSLPCPGRQGQNPVKVEARPGSLQGCREECPCSLWDSASSDSPPSPLVRGRQLTSSPPRGPQVWCCPPTATQPAPTPHLPPRAETGARPQSRPPSWPPTATHSAPAKSKGTGRHCSEVGAEHAPVTVPFSWTPFPFPVSPGTSVYLPKPRPQVRPT